MCEAGGAGAGLRSQGHRSDRRRPGALRGAIDWSRGLLLIDYYDGGGHQSFAHLCGKELEARLPELSRELAADRAVWDDYEMSCADTPPPPECFFNPGESRDHGTRYLFFPGRHPFVLEAIIRLETGAMDLTARDRFIVAKLAEGRATRCP